MKRFSVYKWLDACVNNKCASEQIFMWLKNWAEQAHGMTAEEMAENNLDFSDDWMEEVEAIE